MIRPFSIWKTLVFSAILVGGAGGGRPLAAADALARPNKLAGRAPETVDATVEWPEFHGPRRDNISPETGLLKRWPDGGPALCWQFTDCGFGYSGMAIAAGRIYTAGDFEDQEMVMALDLRGKLLWKSPNGASWTGATPGARTTPTFHEGVVYHMNPTGRLAAFRADTGQEIWAVELKKRFGARHGIWALAENVVVDGDRVLCLPGGPQALAAALDKRTGETLWTTPGGEDKAAYGSPVVGNYQGVRMMITMTEQGIIAVNVKDGTLLWFHPFRRLRISQNTTTPVFHNGYVFVTSGHLTGGELLKINDRLDGVDRVWYRPEFDNCHGGVVLVDGRLYGCGCRLGGKRFFCVDFLTGKTIASDQTVGKVSIAYADGMLYALNHKGPMYLMQIERDGLKIASRFTVPGNSNALYLCHPVVCGGRLYIRHDTHLYCYDIRSREAAAAKRR